MVAAPQHNVLRAARQERFRYSAGMPRSAVVAALVSLPTARLVSPQKRDVSLSRSVRSSSCFVVLP